MSFEERLFQMLEHLRNGAIIVGDYPWCHTFRLTCLQEANKIYTENIVSLIRTRYQGTKTQSYLHIFEDYLQNGCLLAGLACDVDDPSPASLHHAWKESTASVKGRVQVDVKDVVPVLVTHLQKRRMRTDPRVIDNDINPAENTQ